MVCPLKHLREYRIHLKQKSHGPNHLPKKPVQVHNYIWAKLWSYLSLNWPSSSRGGDLKIKNGPVVQKEKIFKFRECIFAFFYYLPLEKDVGLQFQQSWIHVIQGCFLPSLVEIDPVVLEKKILNLVNVILLFRNYPYRKRAWPIIWINLNFHHPRMLSAKFGWNWHRYSGEDF